MNHLSAIRSRPHLLANVRTSGLICRNGPSPFAVVRRRGFESNRLHQP
jgi:hypothetical protein